MSRRRGTRNDTQATMNLTPLSVWFCCNHVPPDKGVTLLEACMLTQKELKSLLSYNADSGVFKWLVNKSISVKKGDIAGRKNKSNPITIMINGVRYQASHLAWLYVKGEMPSKAIDHINGIRSDNRIINLREATLSQNAMNRIKAANNTSGYKGASFHKQSGKWQASIKINGKQKYLGLFLSPKQAHNAYVNAAKVIFGEFSKFC